jgi:hypothetical protein
VIVKAEVHRCTAHYNCFPRAFLASSHPFFFTIQKVLALSTRALGGFKRKRVCESTSELNTPQKAVAFLYIYRRRERGITLSVFLNLRLFLLLACWRMLVVHY